MHPELARVLVADRIAGLRGEAERRRLGRLARLARTKAEDSAAEPSPTERRRDGRAMRPARAETNRGPGKLVPR
jgi:hypothetical protein